MQNLGFYFEEPHPDVLPLLLLEERRIRVRDVHKITVHTI